MVDGSVILGRECLPTLWARVAAGCGVSLVCASAVARLVQVV